MNPSDLILPRPMESFPSNAVVCHLAKLNWIEAAPEDAVAARAINAALVHVCEPARPVCPGKMNIGNRQRISLECNSSLGPEEYSLSISNESIVIEGGDHAGVFYGAQSLCQIITAASALGGMDRFVPSGVIRDRPRFSYRGLMLDSARHFQKKEIIFALLDEMARYKLNRFHWHLVDRQGWRLPLTCAPELTRDLPRSRAYVSGSYTFDEVEEIRRYAEERFITVVPEIEMPGHSAAVFFTHPELACPGPDGHPFESDAWEFCLGNDAVRPFLTEILNEVVQRFPNSPLLHIGGDEASTSHWELCPRCAAERKKLGLSSCRELESHFMAEMAAAATALGVRPVTWGKPENDYAAYRSDMVIQNWLQEDIVPVLRQGFSVINSFHQQNYFDYPVESDVPAEVWQKIQYDFDPAAGVPAELLPLVFGGEGCLWTEQIPQWRVLPRALPRLRALAEVLWSPAEGKDFESFRRRESVLASSGFYPYL